MQQVHQQELLTRRMEDLKEVVFQWVTCKEAPLQSAKEPLSFSPLTKGMEQNQHTDLEDPPDFRSPFVATAKQPMQFPSNGAELPDLTKDSLRDQEKLEQSIKQLKLQEASLRMEIEDSEAKLKTVEDLLMTEEEKHKMYVVKNAKMLYSYNSKLEELKVLSKSRTVD